MSLAVLLAVGARPAAASTTAQAEKRAENPLRDALRFLEPERAHPAHRPRAYAGRSRSYAYAWRERAPRRLVMRYRYAAEPSYEAVYNQEGPAEYGPYGPPPYGPYYPTPGGRYVRLYYGGQPTAYVYYVPGFWMPGLACAAVVAAFFHLPPPALPAIHVVEGGRLGLAHRNTDGSEDLGPMQINTRWLPALSRSTGLPPARLRRALLGSPCFNVAVAGAILRVYLNETNGDVPLAIGDYHSHTPVLNQAYQAQVMQAALRMDVPAPAPAAPQARQRWRRRNR